MREKKSFNERTRVRESDQVRVKYFLVFEGTETEEIYFDAINTNRNDLGIDPIIDFVPLVRDYGEEGWSNPKKILDRVIDNVTESQTGIMTYEILLNRIIDYLSSTNTILGKKKCGIYWKLIESFFKNILNKSLEDEVENLDEVARQTIKWIEEKTSLDNLAKNITEIIRLLAITYDSEIDKICLIVDRDKKSFVVNEHKNQYKYVLDSCKKQNFKLFVTNPCFEFWLLLHFDDYANLDISKLSENPKVTSKKRYTEDELSKRIMFKKNRYDADNLVMNLSNAIIHEKDYCEDLIALENEVGTNLGKLFDEIIIKDIENVR